MSKKKPDFKRCSICGSKSQIETKRSSLTFTAFHSCSTCFESSAEPYSMLVAALSLNELNTDGYETVIEDTLRLTNRTMEQLTNDVSKYNGGY